jgi:hypothetical protein
VTDSLGCRDDTLKIYHVVSVTQIDPGLPDEILIYPNPSRETIVIRIPPYVHAEQILLISLSGQIVKHWYILPSEQKWVYLNTENLKTGPYILSLITREGTINRKVIIN